VELNICAWPRSAGALIVSTPTRRPKRFVHECSRRVRLADEREREGETRKGTREVKHPRAAARNHHQIARWCSRCVSPYVINRTVQPHSSRLPETKESRKVSSRRELLMNPIVSEPLALIATHLSRYKGERDRASRRFNRDWFINWFPTWCFVAFVSRAQPRAET